MPEFTLPYRGINKGAVVDKQPQGTSGYMSNIRPRDALENRLRIGQRPGLDKWGDGDQIGGAAKPVVAFAIVSLASHRTGVLKDSFVEDYDNGYMLNAANDRIAQNFVPSTSYNIRSVKLPLSRSNSPGIVTVAIYAVDGDKKPTGVALATGTTDGDTLSSGLNYEWREITFAAVYALTSGTEYTIVMSAASSDVGNAVNWWYDYVSTSPEARWDSDDGGSGWDRKSITSSQNYKTYDDFTSDATSKRLVTAGNNEIFYEDIDTAAGTMVELAAANGDVDTTDKLIMFEAYQKVFIVNGSNFKVADFINTVLDLGSGNEMTTPPGRGDLLTQTGTSATMLVDFVDSTKRYIYGYVTGGTFNTTGDITQTTQADSTLDAMSPNPITATLDDVTANPHWYDWTVYPSIGSKSYGTMPNKAYIGCLYRGRCTLSGNPEYPFQWYMTRQGNPWDFAYVAKDAQSPVAGGNSDAGEIGDIVKALIPYRDDYLINGCATSMWIMRGDPAAGGSLDELDLTVGMFGPNSWCFDGDGNLYFWGTNGIYRVPRGFGKVENLTQFSLPKIIADEAIDASTHRITMAYDRLRMGLVICITNLSTEVNSNYWFDLRAQGFFPERYPEECCSYSLIYYDANDKDYRELLVGCRDGYIRKFDEAAKDDDVGATDEAISSYFTTVQPLGDGEDAKGKLISLTVTTGGGASGGDFGDTDGVSYEYHVGDDAETVLEDMIDGATARESGTLSGTGRKSRIRKRASGHYLGLKFFNLTDTQTFAIEKISGEIKPAGKN